MIGSVGGPGILLPILAMRRLWRYTCNNAKLMNTKISGKIKGNAKPPAERAVSPARCSTSRPICWNPQTHWFSKLFSHQTLFTRLQMEKNIYPVIWLWNDSNQIDWNVCCNALLYQTQSKPNWIMISVSIHLKLAFSLITHFYAKWVQNKTTVQCNRW